MARKRTHKLPFAEACERHTGRYTLEHMPAWARQTPQQQGAPALPEGTPQRFYAPQYRTDREWYENTMFPGDPGYPFPPRYGAQSSSQTWPMGLWLDKPFTEYTLAERRRAKVQGGTE